jgi:hypothetical protein
LVLKISGKLIGAIFLGMGYLLIEDISITADKIFIVILQGWLGYFIAIIGLGILLSEILEKNKILSFIYNQILVIPAIGFIYFQQLVAPFLSIILFLSIYSLPSMWFLRIGETYPILEQYRQGIVYILSLLSVIFFAYKSNLVMGFIIESFKTRLFRTYLERYTNTAFTRMYTYFLMIAIYILYNFLTFSNVNLNFIPPEMLNVIKEVFVTYVAIDSLLQIYLSKLHKQTGEYKYKRKH